MLSLLSVRPTHTQCTLYEPSLLTSQMINEFVSSTRGNFHVFNHFKTWIMQNYLSDSERNLQNWEYKPFYLAIINIKSQPHGGNL